MITGERVSAYINSLYPGSGGFLEKLEEEARAAHVPVIRRETQSLLRFLIASHRPRDILEVGTAVGFSALFMSAYAPGDCRIVTIENNDRRISEARKNFARAGAEERITLLEGDAMEVLESLNGSYDLIFIDAAKGQYPGYFPRVMKVLEEGGLLVSDNVLQGGEIMESRFAVERRNRTIHARMREYLYVLTHHEELTTSILPVGDGVTVSVRTGKNA
ncbi:MAG: O-methyltransferase [Lachnospiraceae bacterium]